MCSGLDRTAWRADDWRSFGWRSRRRSARSQYAILSRWSAIGIPKLSLTMRFWRSVAALTVFGHRILGIWEVVCGTWTIRPWIAGSPPLDANGLHHLAPLLGFIGDELTKVDRRARKGHSAQLGKPRLDLGIGKARIDLFVERFDDIGRRALGCAKAGNSACLVARQEIPNGRHVRQRLRARGSCHPQRAQIARPDVCGG